MARSRPEGSSLPKNSARRPFLPNRAFQLFEHDKSFSIEIITNLQLEFYGMNHRPKSLKRTKLFLKRQASVDSKITINKYQFKTLNLKHFEEKVYTIEKRREKRNETSKFREEEN